MSSRSLNGHIDQGNIILAHVWYSSNAALKEGEAVCYNMDYGSAAGDREPRRYNEVETPTTLNAQHFAGVSSCEYSAVSGGQFIDIYLPGSVCNVWFNADVVLNTGLYTFDVTSSYEGFFRYAGLPGAGSVQPLQTVTRASTAGLGLAYLMEGPQSGGVEVVPLVATGAMATQMVGGTTLITGAAISSGDNTTTLADGTIPGIRKKYGIITTELTAYDVIITVTSGATDDVDDVSLDTITFPGASTCLNTVISLYWDGAWMIQAKSEDIPALAGS